MDPAACSACSLLALGRRDGEPLHWGHPGLPLAFPLRPLAPLHPGKGRGGEAGAVPCSQRSLNARCGDLVLVPQEHSLAGSSWGVTSALLGGRLDPGQVGWPVLVSVLGSDIWKGFPPPWAAPGLVEGVRPCSGSPGLGSVVKCLLWHGGREKEFLKSSLGIRVSIVTGDGCL